ncbi:uncharacterized protein LOC113471670 [Diaphorina citri]|uniref:Uncharacterized protein LOC113471670 n=1 Tax=Diaphorina citri TaxID=121845 RepID=A0A3Q0JE80_DIACI|nr:uncharacterized protein LOC113471670 [Diaphorina citri]
MLPLTEHVMMFQDYLVKLGDENQKLLKENLHDEKAFKTLTNVALASTIVFNRRRIGDVQYLPMETYKGTSRDQSTLREMIEKMSESEKVLTQTNKHVVAGGKGSRAIEIFFPPAIQSYIETLLEARNNFVPRTIILTRTKTGEGYKIKTMDMCGGASCLLSPQTAPSQPAPAAVSPPQSAPAAAPPSRPAPAVLLPPLLVGATSGPASAPPAGPSQPSAAAYPYMIPPQGLLGHYPHIDPGYYGLYHGGYQGPPHRSHMGIPPRDTPPVPSEDDDEEESNSEDEAGISHPLFSLAPSTREREPSVPDPDPELASQGISCQKLGSPAWNRVRYSESQKALQAGGVFKPLSVPGEIPLPNSSTFENLSRQDSFLGTLSHGLLLQRNALSGAMNTLAEKFPEVREELGSIFSDDGELKQVSDNLLQYVCGKRAECFEARRRLVEPKDPQLARLVRAIPPSPSCLFEEAQFTDFVKAHPLAFRPTRPTPRPMAPSREFRVY